MHRLLLAASALFVGCSAPPILWEDPVSLGVGEILGSDSAVVSAVVAKQQCPSSVRVAREDGAAYAVWWRVRSDSSADLVLAPRRGVDNSTWEAPLLLDSLDAGRAGCRRAPPAIVADRGNIHVIYAMTASEGPGVFTVHVMDGGAMVHAPVAVVYGERYGLASIAAKGDLVVAAYEDPNTEPRRIGFALSRTMGHLFQHRTLISPSSSLPAHSPTVTLDSHNVQVFWKAGSERFVRRGVIQ